MAMSLQLGIPEFLSDQIVYCDKLVLRHGQQSCLLLARNLKLYEFSRQQVVYSADLANSCLAKVAQKLSSYEGPRGKWLEFASVQAECTPELASCRAGLMETSVLHPAHREFSMHTRPGEDAKLCFGKYIYSNFEVYKLYVLVRCWDKLVVLQLLSDDCVGNGGMHREYQIVTEYEQVKSFKIVHGKLKFQAAIEVCFENNETICTDFQHDSGPSERADSAPLQRVQRSDLRLTLLERVRCAKAELQLHKATTQKEFSRLSSTQGLGCNFLRSLKLEEKSMLTRCGDMWLRYTPTDALVIGVPLVNNCAPPNLTILKYLKPILKINNTAAAESIDYRYRLYQLRQQFQDLESLETFFQCEDAGLQQPSTTAWRAMEQPQLLPNSFVVLLIELKIAQIITLEECPLLLNFAVEKSLSPAHEPSARTRLYEQHLFLKCFNFAKVLSERQAYEIRFSETTLQQDFLAIAATTEETKLQIEFMTLQDAEKFDRLLVRKFEFECVNRAAQPKDSSADTNDVGDDAHAKPISWSCVFYNKNAASMWYGALAVRACQTQAAHTPNLKSDWLFYVNGKEKAFLLLKLLFSELILLKCNIANVEYVGAADAINKAQLVEFHEALARELAALQTLASCEDEARKGLQRQLMELQIQTDFLAFSTK